MAKFKRRARTRFVRARTSHRRGSSGTSGTKLLIGSVGYGVVKPFATGLTSKFGFGLPDNLIQLGAGYLLMKKGGIVGDVAKAAVVYNAVNLTQQVTQGGGFGALFGGTAATTATAAANPSDWSNG